MLYPRLRHSEKAGEEDFIADTHLGCHFDDFVRHIAGTRHNKLDVIDCIDNFLCGGKEILRASLHCDSPEEQDYFVFFFRRDMTDAIAIVLNSVVNYFNFSRKNIVMFYYCFFG